ncbi:MAG: hypothetical protein QNK03_19110 [Myxococcota bacterium]|nr:hypothetical protein [Myxococcota bacterium]
MLAPRSTLILALAALACLAVAPCSFGTGSFRFLTPAQRQLSLVGPVAWSLDLPRRGRIETLVVEVDGVPLDPGAVAIEAGIASGVIEGLAAGEHVLRAVIQLDLGGLASALVARQAFGLVALRGDPDACEVLSDVDCMLPYPSSRFLEPDASRATGVRLALTPETIPGFPVPFSPADLNRQDGFSPLVQLLTAFEGGVDPELSNAPRLLAATRSTDGRSLESDSPTLLLDVTDGLTPVLHFVEPDARAARGAFPERELLFLRPAAALQPGHRYVVAMRSLVRPDGTPIQAEPVFAALRDRRPTTIDAVEQRRPDMEALFALLEQAGVARHELLLAFDFVVQSEEELTRELVAMRARALDWLDAQWGETFTVFPLLDDPPEGTDASLQNDCADPGERVWRLVRGTFTSPLFLDSDPLLAPTVGGRLVDEDGDGLPEIQGTMQANFEVAIPCGVLDEGGTSLPPILLGHGLFGNAGGASLLANALDGVLVEQGLGRYQRIGGATDWLGLSSYDFSVGGASFITNAVLFDPANFGTLPDRLRQGVVNTLVLARMMKRGAFNTHPAFRVEAEGPGGGGTPPAVGVFDTGAELDYFGVSLGGIMGLLTAAVSPDLRRVAVDVPASNFSVMIQRSTAIGLIAAVLDFLNRDAMSQAIFFSLGTELWDSAEPGGYLHHVVRDPLPGSGEAKDVLMTVARFDGVVSNEASEMTARGLGIPNLYDASGPAGSAVNGLLGIPDQPAPLAEGDADFVGAMVYHDLGMYDLDDPEILPFVPPLANDTAASNCDPHGRSFRTGAGVQQITTWLATGVIDDFCEGVCDGFSADGTEPEPFELSEGREVPCDPLTEPPPSFGR